LRSEKEVREFQLEMLRVQLRHEERTTFFTTLVTCEIALMIFYIGLIVLGLQLLSQLATSGGTELTTWIITNLMNYGIWGASSFTIIFVATCIVYYIRVSKKKDEEIENIRKRFIE